jgi:hypothetical protein
VGTGRTLAFAVAAVLVVGACQRAKPAPAEANAAPSPTPAQAPMPPPVSATGRFWEWFEQHAVALQADDDLVNVMETISAALAKVNPRVIAEIASTDVERTLVLSANGDPELFPVVHEIYAARPTVAGWRIVAFRPRSGLDAITMHGKRMEPAKMKFVGTRDGDKLEIVVFVPDFTTTEDLGPVGFLVLDHVVGEYDMETRIGGVEFAALKKAPAKARPLTELPALLDKTFPRR